MRGRRPKTDAEKAAAGRPSRRRIPEPVSPSIAEECPPPPASLQGSAPVLRRAREIWDELAPQLHAHGLLTVLDVGTFATQICLPSAELEACARVVAEEGATVSTESGGLKRRPEAALLTALQQQLRLAGSEFGLSPRTRAGLQGRPVETPAAELSPQDRWREKGRRLQAKKRKR